MSKSIKRLLACTAALTILSTGAATTAVTVNNVYHPAITAHAAADNYTPDQTLAQNTIKPIQDQLKGAKLQFDGGSFIVNDNHADLNTNNANPQAKNDPMNNGRAMGGFAVVNQSTTTNADRNATGNGSDGYKPAGWAQSKISNSDWLYNRGHLLAYAMVGNIQGFDASEHNQANIVTETEWANQAKDDTSKGQAYFENQVFNAIDQGKTIVYQVKALYAGNEQVPRAIWIQAKSTDGQFQENALVPNCMKGQTINYQNGNDNQGQNQNNSHANSNQGQNQSQQNPAQNAGKPTTPRPILPPTGAVHWFQKILTWLGIQN